MRLLFIPRKDDTPAAGDILEFYLCRDCGTPEEYKDNFCMIAYPRYPSVMYGSPNECFVCAKHFNGNEAATEVIIELTKPKGEK